MAHPIEHVDQVIDADVHRDADEDEDSNADNIQDDDQAIGVDAYISVAVSKVPCYELSYSNQGVAIKVKVFEELREVAGLDFLELNLQNPAIANWMLNCTGLRKMKHRNDRCSDLKGMHQLRELRNAKTVQHATQRSSIAAIARPSTFLMKKMKLRNELTEPAEYLEIEVEGKDVRVIPRVAKDSENLWICSEDIEPCIRLIKKQGMHSELDELPVGISKRKRKGFITYEVRKKTHQEGKSKYLYVKTLEEAIELQHAESYSS
jgi:hypothetical protein